MYVWLSTALPRSGGDYVFQSRVFGGGIAFTVVMSGYVIWILQWVALSGWLLAYLGFAPLFLGLGATMGSQSLSNLGVWFTTPWGIIITSIVNALAALWLLVSGFKNYVKFQYVMWYGTLLAFGVMLVVLFTANPANFIDKINAFAVASGGGGNFYQTAVEAAKGAGVDLNPPFSLLATLLVAPIAWTSLQWATYSAQQNGEIKDARSFKSQTFIIVGSLIATGLLLAVLAVALERAVGTEFLNVAGAGYWAGVTEATVNGFWLWPNIIAVALSASPLIVLIIGIGYILNSFQIVNNCYIGMTRVMVAMSLDRLLPEWVSKVDEKLHTPVNAHLAYFLASIPVILLYNLYGGWVSLTLGVTFACGYVFVVTCLAGALLPYRAKDVYEASPGAKYKLGNAPLVTILGAIGFVLGGAMVMMFMLYDALGLTSSLAYTVVFAVLAVSAVWYFLAKSAQMSRGINVEFAFKEIPPE
ncbi:MAG: APC family permease [Chloroflexi bacterium]|nr:APC family permease [Chloroflexota bacterium]